MKEKDRGLPDQDTNLTEKIKRKVEMSLDYAEAMSRSYPTVAILLSNESLAKRDLAAKLSHTTQEAERNRLIAEYDIVYEPAGELARVAAFSKAMREFNDGEVDKVAKFLGDQIAMMLRRYSDNPDLGRLLRERAQKFAVALAELVQNERPDK